MNPRHHDYEPHVWKPGRPPALPCPALEIPASVPFAYLYEYGSSEIPAILPDDRGGARLAIDHLTSVGARKIAFLNGPREWEATTDRLAGFHDGLEAAGLQPDDRLITSAETWQPEDGYRVMNELLERSAEIDAVFCASDDLATGAMAALHDRGISIPGDIQVVGFDNRSLAIHQRPPLTTIALPLIEMGARAGSLVLSAIDGTPLPHKTIRVPCSLVSRASTKGY